MEAPSHAMKSINPCEGASVSIFRPAYSASFFSRALHALPDSLMKGPYSR